MLNASRHHRKNRQATLRTPIVLEHLCSTPRGITGKIACHGRRADRTPAEVLNASRHHRKNRGVTAYSSKPRSHWCSTPRGITGKIARLPTVDLDANLGAQRLAASQEKSRERAETRRADTERCSTPRGITGKIADVASANGRNAHVLNASRHHRKNRISADSEGFESQTGCSTPRGITGKIARGSLQGFGSDAQCSTPRGITGKIARRVMSCHRRACRAQRLAASQEKSPRISTTSASVTDSAQRLAASQEKSLLLTLRRPSASDRAQRLAASQEKSHTRGRDVRSTLLVLNASRHHRKNRFGHDSACSRRVTWASQESLDARILPIGAQRLAASQEKSLGLRRR